MKETQHDLKKCIDPPWKSALYPKKGFKSKFLAVKNISAG
jgi:hypothetical protein